MPYCTLTKEISYLLEVPFSKATQIRKAIKKSLTEALRRGERIEVEGFGVFKIRTRPSTRASVVRFYGRKVMLRETIVLPPKRYVHFVPSKILLAMLNGE